MSQPKWIPMDKLVDRNIYEIKCRNLLFGAWSESTKAFIGIREKFGSKYLFAEYARETGPPHGTASAIRDTGVRVPDDVEMVEMFKVLDPAGEHVAWTENEKLRAILDGFDE